MRTWTAERMRTGMKAVDVITTPDDTLIFVPAHDGSNRAQFIDACNARERAKFILSDFEVTGRWGGDAAMLAQLHDLIPASPDADAYSLKGVRYAVMKGGKVVREAKYRAGAPVELAPGESLAPHPDDINEYFIPGSNRTRR